MNQREHYYWLPQLIKHDHNIREIFVEKKNTLEDCYCTISVTNDY